ncbi:MAG TPA: hypothetical protein VGH15_05015 [Caulobacteraceae bacterium]|jgi:hypothetical protein
MTRRSSRLLGALALALLLSACAAGGVESHQAAQGGILSQFLLGLWHGIISPITLLVEIGHKLFPGIIPWAIRLYETRDATVVYDVGFYLGLAGAPSMAFRRWS